MTQSIVIAERDNIAAVFEQGKVTEFFIHRGDVLLGDVYLSKVDNILPSIDAAFVDVGCSKMGFLHAADVMGRGSLRDKLKPKQNLVVQVTKEPTGHKGPRVTTEISLPGRFLVLIPNESGINISKKIESVKERARLKALLNVLKPVGVGVIVRTEASGQSESDIQDDLEVLLEKWNTIVTLAQEQSAPNLLYRDQDLLYRVIREACTEDTHEIIVDTPFAMTRVQNLLQNWNMSKGVQVSVYKGNAPFLDAAGVTKEIKAALQTKVNMPSGGYLYIQTTEALSVIDVNSGKFVSSATQDEMIFKTNKEAVAEIARQLKLRNIGGMIIIDFIDMCKRSHKLRIMEELELALDSDKAKPQVGQLSDLGLVELTRHRQGQSLYEIFTKKCQTCMGTGSIIEDFHFASATSEGSYRSKAAKIGVPANQLKGKKRSGKNNKVFNYQNGQNGTPGADVALDIPVEQIVSETQNVEIKTDTVNIDLASENEKNTIETEKVEETKADVAKSEPSKKKKPHHKAAKRMEKKESGVKGKTVQLEIENKDKNLTEQDNQAQSDKGTQAVELPEATVFEAPINESPAKKSKPYRRPRRTNKPKNEQNV